MASLDVSLDRSYSVVGSLCAISVSSVLEVLCSFFIDSRYVRIINLAFVCLLIRIASISPFACLYLH